MKIVNKTGRDLTIFSSAEDQHGAFYPADGPPVKYPGFLGRGKTETIEVEMPNGVAALPVTFSAPTPSAVTADQFEGGVLYVVAFPVENAAALGLGRKDLLRMGPARMLDGKQVGAEGFQSSLTSF